MSSTPTNRPEGQSGAPQPPRPQSFEMIAAATGAFSPEEMDRLIAWCDEHGTTGKLTGERQEEYRRSKVAWCRPDDGFDWLFQRIGRMAGGFNQRFFGFEITGIEQALQVARYEAGAHGHYDWHTDFSMDQQRRKISISVQLSAPEDYEGGDLELDISSEPTRAGRERGLAVAFPSFVRHRVAPVTRGVRYSLVAWIHGPRWR